MAAQNRYATLESDLMGKGADMPPALPSRRRTIEHLTGRPALSVAPTPVPVAAAAEPTAPTAGDVFYDKGAATADNFRPSYWTYDKSATETAPEPAVVLAEPAAIDEPPSVDAAAELPSAENVADDEPPAVIGLPPEPATVPSRQPAAADELAATIEHVLGSRYSGVRQAAPESETKPRVVGAAVTFDTLMAELAEARQARVGDTKAAVLRQTVRPPRKTRSLVDRAFAMGGVALVLFALFALSPWAESFLPNGLSHFLH
jgi:hypothetical protein